MDDGPVSGNFRNGLGETALVLGLVALVFAFVPVIGDVVAVPAALLAIGLGMAGLRRAEKGLASNAGQAAAGTVIGTAATSVLVIFFIAALDR